LLEVRGLSVSFPSVYGHGVEVVRDVSLAVREGECIGIVGESGSGKTLLGLSAIGLLPRGSKQTGNVIFRGRDMTSVGERYWRRLRGNDIAMIYQDALTSLNPSVTINFALRQVCRMPGARYAPDELLSLVSLHEHRRILASYPHELSGGQRQRILVGMALARQPRLIIADEPTTALDLTVQAEIIVLLQELRSDLDFSLILISHDLGLVSTLAGRIAVMYAGTLVEVGDRASILHHPRHPYTAALIRAASSLDDPNADPHVVPGLVPSPSRYPSGCRFRDRCERAVGLCETEPGLVGDEVGGGQLACFNPIQPVMSTESRS
jgi:oligopeptide/dipeptide ABC transporter ATP-binding protein